MQTYRQQQIEGAEAELSIARQQAAAAKTRAARRESAELVDFWATKLAFLTNLRPGAFADEVAA